MKFITVIFITALFSITLLFTSCVTTRLPCAEPIVKKTGGEEEKIDVKDVVIPESQEDTKLGILEQMVEELNKEFGSYDRRELSAYSVGSEIVSIEKLYYYDDRNRVVHIVSIVNNRLRSVDTIRIEKSQK